MFSIIDITLFRFFNGTIHNIFFDWIMPVFSETWLMWLGACLGIFAYGVHCSRSGLDPFGRVVMLILLIGLSVGTTDITTSLLKHSIGRERPCQELAGTYSYSMETEKWSIVEDPATDSGQLGGSMPSSPAAACMSVAVILSFLFYRSNPWIYFLPLLVGFSQIYLGRNYPFDIIVGWIIGFIAVVVVWWVCHLIFSRFSIQRKLKSEKTNFFKK